MSSREQPPFNAGQSEKRNEDQRNDERRIHDARTNLQRRTIDNSQRRLRLFKQAVFAQAAEDIFDVNDGVVNEFTDGDGKAARPSQKAQLTGALEMLTGKSALN